MIGEVKMRKNEIENRQGDPGGDRLGQDLGLGGDDTISQYPPDIPRSIAAIHLGIRLGTRRVFLTLREYLSIVLYAVVKFYKGAWD